jgi:kumamolisin
MEGAVGGNRVSRHAAAVGLAGSVVLALSLVAGVGTGAGASPAPSMVPIGGSFLGTPDASNLGRYAASRMGIEVVLQPSDPAAVTSELTALYDPSSPTYHQWLAPGTFAARFAPSASVRQSVARYLVGSGLKVVKSSSPFLVRAVGSSDQVAGAFATTIDRYAAPTGQTFFAGAAPAEVPADLASSVVGVIGLSDTGQENALNVPASRTSATAHYGAGPHGSGLTPSQLDGIYNAGAAVAAGPRGQGKGVTMAVFELSGYTPSDITTYAKQFFGPSYKPKVRDINVDGGPITPVCPPGDHCFRKNDHSGDIEVEADIETQIAIAPRAKLIVYNAPNDKTSQTSVDEYLQIASDDLADSVSASWGLCEQDIGAAAAAAENVAFTEMAMQGQSITAASGDDGAYDCLQDGTTNHHDIAVDDPSSQPLVTGVGGTSLESFNPKSDPHPTLPAGVETVWNINNECSGTDIVACEIGGAGGGGESLFWLRPAFQKGPGVQALHNREDPDVSAVADEDTPYWAAVIGDAVGFNGTRFGTATMTLYPLFRQDYSTYFNDITGVGQTENQNGHYPVTPGYDMATGIGTPNIGAIVTETGSTVP